jgi:glucose/arabinose dehydrogenase
MRRAPRPAALLLALLALAAGPTAAEIRQTEAGPVEIEAVATGFDVPWALDFLPGGGVLVTERGGQLIHVRADGARDRVSGTPDVWARGQGGLLDVMVPRDFAESREVFLTYSRPQPGGAGTALARGRLTEAGDRLEDLELLWQLAPGSSGGRHFGSRVAEGPDGLLYVSVGDRGDRPSAQDVSNENGAIVRLTRDGAVPEGNPLVGQEGARPGIWSWGHRNPQGLGFDAEDRLWAIEHGARGGDEVNLVQRGRNYGWPVISYGRHYSGLPIGEGTAKEGLEQPAHYWDPSIAPSGMAFIGTGMFPGWEGDMMTGSLNSDFLSRLQVDGTEVREVERIATPETRRVRDVAVGPDGAVWFLSEGNGALYRMTPAPGG